MKKAICYMMMLMLVALLLGAGAATAKANSLENIGVSRDGDSIVVTITTFSSCEYNVFLTDSKPERIVIDLVGVENNFDQKQFKQLPLYSIHSIRTSQFKSQPDLQARVVLDIERPIEFRSYGSENKIFVKLPSIADEVQFASWQYPGNDYVEQASIEPKPVTEAAPAVEPEKAETVESEPVAPAPEKQGIATDQPEVVASQKEDVVESKPVAAAPEREEAIEPEADDDEELADVDPEAEAIMPPDLSVGNPSTPSGLAMDTSPKRQVVEYISMGLKDPFEPLVGAGSGRITEGLPSLENLKLVGILADPETNRALLEDAEGNGFMLKPNDKIRGGYLVTVTESKAIFQVTEYGWTRTVALELTIPEIK
jgi:hypothetical protein